ncbi:hypothetical protein AVEN_198387-1 [Araneus ventricosus]|uniref:Pre-C2HC domain-containing protein n=1 Tax=Araneus ventricosus TaxID=182803 RepID=A0A4Y2FMA2_ARAVE|nr:hypothetical protein AVEN_198387-1 [Araneus ventricosus]
MACLDRIRNTYGRCPVWNCDKHPAKDGDFQSEMDISSSTDTAPEIDEEEEIAPWKRNGIMHGSGFQLVSPCKAARPTTMEMDTTPVETTNKFSQLDEGNAPITPPRKIPEINLKVTANVNQTLKEICQQFPHTENRLQKDFIRIRADSEDSRGKIIKFLKEKNLEFVLSEAFEDRPLKVVIRDLPREMDKQEIQQCLEEAGFKIERITQMKNFREKCLHPLFLTDVKKIGNYANIYNFKELCYYRIKVEPYRKRKKATIHFDC